MVFISVISAGLCVVCVKRSFSNRFNAEDAEARRDHREAPEVIELGSHLLP